MGDHRPERIAMRFVPRQHPAQIAASLRALERLRLVGQVIGADADLIGVVVNRRIGCRHFLRRERTLDHQIAVYFKEILFCFVHHRPASPYILWNVDTHKVHPSAHTAQVF